MKRIVWLLICLSTLLLPDGYSQEQIQDMPILLPQEIKDAYWFAKGGKIELKEGSWHFGVKEKRLNLETEEVVDADYICFCRFTIINNSETAYKINPSISLLEYERASLYRIPPAAYFGEGKEHQGFRNYYDKIRLFKPKILAPGAGYTFEDEFDVSKEVVSKTSKLKLELSIVEVKKK